MACMTTALATLMFPNVPSQAAPSQLHLLSAALSQLPRFSAAILLSCISYQLHLFSAALLSCTSQLHFASQLRLFSAASPQLHLSSQQLSTQLHFFSAASLHSCLILLSCCLTLSNCLASLIPQLALLTLPLLSCAPLSKPSTSHCCCYCCCCHYTCTTAATTTYNATVAGSAADAITTAAATAAPILNACNVQAIPQLPSKPVSRPGWEGVHMMRCSNTICF